LLKKKGGWEIGRRVITTAAGGREAKRQKGGQPDEVIEEVKTSH